MEHDASPSLETPPTSNQNGTDLQLLRCMSAVDVSVLWHALAFEDEVERLEGTDPEIIIVGGAHAWASKSLGVADRK